MARIAAYLIIPILLICFLLFGHRSPVGIAHSLQTIPTRTAVPPPTVPPPPTSPPKGDDDSPPPPPPPPPAAASATAMPSPAATNTPSPEPIPLDELCSDQPRIQTNGLTNVRTGPGVDHQVIAQLPYLASQPIIARAGDAPWWLIMLDDGQEGWIIDEAVVVSGHIGVIPIAEIPLIGNATATPGVAWNPTPFPFCPELPATTPAPPISPTQTPLPMSTGAPATAEAQPTKRTVATMATLPPTTVTQVLSATDTPTALPATAVESTEAASPVPASTTVADLPDNPPETTAASPPQPTAAPLPESVPRSSADYLLVVSALLFFVGIAVILWRRRR